MQLVLAPLLFLAAASAGGQSELAVPRFDRAVLLETTSETSANVSVGDLDGDGDLDVVLAKGRHWPLLNLVLLNDGEGGFEERHAVSTRADRTYTAALADLDGDGDLDLVVGNDAPDEKRIHFNDGDGRFSAGGTFGDARWPTRNVAVGDVSGDHRPDIVVANRGARGPSANYLCLNDGRGRFSSCTSISTDSATTIAIGQLDGDEVPDLVIPHRDGGQSYAYFGDGRGGFAPGVAFGPSVSATRAVAVVDIDANGLDDIVVGDEEGGGGHIYLNRGNGTFSDPMAIAEPGDVFYSIAIADLNRDGRPDIVVGNRETRALVLVTLLVRGELRFEEVRFGDDGGAVYGLAVGDVNGDGTEDVLAARSGAPNVLYLNELRPIELR